MMPTTASISCKLISPLLVLTTLFYSCNGRNDTTNIMALEEGLINSNRVIEMSSNLALNALHNKLFDPRTHSFAEIWFPRAQKIQELSKDIYGFIDDLKKESNPDDTKIAALYDRLIKYKNDILGLDSSIRKTFSNNLILATKAFDESKQNLEAFKKSFFNHVSKAEKGAILTRFQNNVKIIENELVIFCNEIIGITWDGFDNIHETIKK
jgi:hypothetical protein